MQRALPRRRSVLVAAVAVATLVGCAEVERTPSPRPAAPPAAESRGAAPPDDAARAVLRGRISYYGPGFEGRPTASGTPFDPAALTMAHRRLPFGTRVRVTNLRTLQSVEVTVNDRGPYVDGRIADLSEGAARRIGMVDDGVVEATLEVLTARGADGPG